MTFVYYEDQRVLVLADLSVLVNVHDAHQCMGAACVIHKPTEHHMRSWPLGWRSDRGIFERQCPHGIGHPDPDQDQYMRVMLDDPGVHGCDGCCWIRGESP